MKLIDVRKNDGSATMKGPISINNNINKTTAMMANNLQQQQRQQVTKLKKVGDYIFIKQIGHGAFSTVHLAKHFSNAKKVAIKMIPNSKLSPSNLNRVQSEIKILLSLNHRNIVKILDLKKTSQNQYLIFEFCGNGDLESYIKKHYEGHLSETLAQQVMFQVCDAFRLLNKHKIVHRDLKLANILVDDEFTIKIADFGFAKLNSHNDLLHSTLGTPITMAPEILFGKEYNEKCDIWSLGVIIYQMVFGKPPFMPARGGGISGLMKEIQKEAFEFPESKPISIQLRQLLTRMLKVDPAQRIGFTELFTNEWITRKVLMPSENGKVLSDGESDLTKSLQKMKQIYGNQKASSAKVNEVKSELEEDVSEFNDVGDDDVDIDLEEDMMEALENEENKVESESKPPQQELIIDEKLMAGVIKIALSLRKYHEKRICAFLLNCESYFQMISELKATDLFAENEQVRQAMFLVSLLIASKIQSFIAGEMSVRIEGDTFQLGSYSDFTANFIDKNDPSRNFTSLLIVRLQNLKNILSTLRSSSVPAQFDSHSPEYLFLRSAIQSLSYHQATKGSKGKEQLIKFLRELVKYNETMQLPSLQLQSELCNADSETKALFRKVQSIPQIIQKVLQSDKKTVRFSQFPFQIKLGLINPAVDTRLDENEALFRQISKTLTALLTGPTGTTTTLTSMPQNEVANDLEFSEVIAD